MNLDFGKYYDILKNTHLTKDSGKVTDVTGLLIKGYIPGVSIGSICEIQGAASKPLLAEVVGFKDRQVLMMSLSDMRGISMGSKNHFSKVSCDSGGQRRIIGTSGRRVGPPVQP